MQFYCRRLAPATICSPITALGVVLSSTPPKKSPLKTERSHESVYRTDLQRECRSPRAQRHAQLRHLADRVYSCPCLVWLAYGVFGLNCLGRWPTLRTLRSLLLCHSPQLVLAGWAAGHGFCAEHSYGYLAKARHTLVCAGFDFVAAGVNSGHWARS